MLNNIVLLFGTIIIIYFFYKTRLFIKELINNFSLLASLSTSDLKIKYAGSYLGIVWAYAQLILTTFIYWFIFQIGFKSAPVKDFPFILWLVTGLVPWFFFSDVIVMATGCMGEYSYLVKKVIFNIDILPAMKLLSSLFVHLVFVAFICLLYIIYGIPFDLYVLQAVYYSICLIVFCLGVIYLTATINVFVKDTLQAISIIMQFIFWLTPVVWDIGIMPDVIQKILKINPLYYIITGYRDAFINKVWFWDKYNQTIYFWLITSGMLLLGTWVFRRFKPHFADVL